MKNQYVNHQYFLGKHKTLILAELSQQNLNYIEFVHWLAVPALGILINFQRQICEKIGKL